MEIWDFAGTALYEQRFWLQVLGDHARFIRNALSPSEKDEIYRADCFIRSLDSLLETARCAASAEELHALNENALQKAQELRSFKLHLLQRQLIGHIGLGLPPTFLNHMVNEVEEALAIMACLTRGEQPPQPAPLHLHLLWLSDAAGHAGTIQDNLDATEKRLKAEGAEFVHQFQDFYLKAVEFAGYLRTHVRHFPALHRFNKEVELEMTLFLEFLRELEEMGLTHEVLGVLTPLMADHMAREELYYLTKLSQVADVAKPKGDPTAPRVEAP